MLKRNKPILTPKVSRGVLKLQGPGRPGPKLLRHLQRVFGFDEQGWRARIPDPEPDTQPGDPSFVERVVLACMEGGAVVDMTAMLGPARHAGEARQYPRTLGDFDPSYLSEVPGPDASDHDDAT